MDDTWVLIQQIYQKNFNIPPRIVDLVSIEQALAMCADGKSNSTIAYAFGWLPQEIEFCLNLYLEFPGWKNDLDISPLMMYNSYYRDYRVYKYNILNISPLMTYDEVKDSFYVCKKYYSIKKEIEKYWK